MRVQIGRWGNSLAVRLPKDLVDRFNLSEGGELDLDDFAQWLEAKELRDAQSRREAALQWIASRRISLPADYKFDRDEANAR